MTQKDKILAHLKSGRSITGREAWLTYRIYRLSDVILKLRAKGYDIKTRMVDDPETGGQFGEYHMTESVNA